MRLGRTFGVGALAIVLLALGGIAIIRAIDGPEPSRASPSPGALSPEGSAGYAQPSSPESPEARGDRAAPSGAMSRDVRMKRRKALMAARNDLVAGFTELGERVRECGAQDSYFVLSLEAIAGAVRVEGARTEERGTATDDELDCALDALKGEEIAAPNMVPGRRWEAPFAAPARQERP